MHLKHVFIGGLTTFLLATTPSMAMAQGSGAVSSQRLIDFDQERTVCVSAGAQLLDAPLGNLISTVASDTDMHAIAITLDQNWIALRSGDSSQLAQINFVTFTPC